MYLESPLGNEVGRPLGMWNVTPRSWERVHSARTPPWPRWALLRHSRPLHPCCSLSQLAPRPTEPRPNCLPHPDPRRWKPGQSRPPLPRLPLCYQSRIHSLLATQRSPSQRLHATPASTSARSQGPLPSCRPSSASPHARAQCSRRELRGANVGFLPGLLLPQCYPSRLRRPNLHLRSCCLYLATSYAGHQSFPASPRIQFHRRRHLLQHDKCSTVYLPSRGGEV
jgi:hypothetical protein